jgi:hypothetical protein
MAKGLRPIAQLRILGETRGETIGALKQIEARVAGAAPTEINIQ